MVPFLLTLSALLQPVVVGDITIPSADRYDAVPEPIHREIPAYPFEALDLKADGKVWIRVLVDRAGKVTRATVEHSSRLQCFDDAAVEGAFLWTFEPARMRGKPAECYAVLPFEFLVAGLVEPKINLRRLDAKNSGNGPINKLSFSSTGLLASGGDFGAVIIWRLRDDRLVRFQELPGRKEKITAMAFRPDGYRLVTGSEHGSIQVWSISKEWTLRETEGSDCPVRDIAFSPDGAVFASAGCGVTLRRTEDGAPLRLLDAEREVIGVSFHPDGTLLRAVDRFGAVLSWRVPGGEPVLVSEPVGFEVAAVAFHPDGERVALGGCGDRAELRRLADGALISTFTGDAGCVRGLWFTRDAEYLVTVAEERGLRFRRVDDGSVDRCYLTYGDGMESLTFHPDGRLLCWQSIGDVQLWTLEGGE